MNKTYAPHALFLFLAAALVARAAVGMDIERLEDKKFTLSVTPYAWLIDLKGTVGARGYSLPVDAKFTTSAKHVNFAAMLAVDAVYKNSFGISANVNYALLGSNGTVRGLSLNGDSSLLLNDVAGFYRLISVPFSCSGKAGFDFDLLAGMRLWRAGLKLDARIPNRKVEYSQNELWVDPILGARAVFRMGDRWSVRLRGGYGGFSVSSKRTWDVAALAGYTLRRNVSLVAGYRAVGVDYRKHSGNERFIFNTTLKGPLAGVVFTF